MNKITRGHWAGKPAGARGQTYSARWGCPAGVPRWTLQHLWLNLSHGHGTMQNRLRITHQTRQFERNYPDWVSTHWGKLNVVKVPECCYNRTGRPLPRAGSLGFQTQRVGDTSCGPSRPRRKAWEANEDCPVLNKRNQHQYLRKWHTKLQDPQTGPRGSNSAKGSLKTTEMKQELHFSECKLSWHWTEDSRSDWGRKHSRNKSGEYVLLF